MWPLDQVSSLALIHVPSGLLLLLLLNGLADACLCTSSPSFLCSSLFWHRVQMREHLQTGPEPHKIPLLGYHQALAPTFPKTVANSPHTHQVWSGHNQLLVFIIHLSLANAQSCSLAGEGRHMRVLLVLFLEICPLFPTILFSLVASPPNMCLPQGTFSKFATDTPIPQDLWTSAQSFSSSSLHCVSPSIRC
jgi:hypothetical protein